MKKATLPIVAVAPALDVAGDAPALSQDPPPLENEQPHKALAQATKLHAKLTEELRKLKADWAAENIRAQQTHVAIATSKITFVEKRRRELHLELARLRGFEGYVVNIR
jgi:hypothetical protein